MPDIAKLRSMRAACGALCIAGYLPLSGCLFQKKPPRTFVPPVIAGKVAPQPQDLKLPELPPDFSLEIESPSIDAALSLPPAPVKPTPPKTVARPPATAEPIVTPPSVPVNPPKPQTIYSAEDRRQMTKELNDLQDHVRKVLERAGGKNLSPDLAKLAADARNFSEQAEQARERDLLTAVSLARRADFLATDLSARLP